MSGEFAARSLGGTLKAENEHRQSRITVNFRERTPRSVYGKTSPDHHIIEPVYQARNCFAQFRRPIRPFP
jgi:hypothetical protein